jgi:NitT/TauT family transport system substrate-binding protein
MNRLDLNRRHFLSNSVGLGTSALLGLPEVAFGEPPPEVKKIRLVYDTAVCIAPQYLAEELLYLEGFTQSNGLSCRHPMRLPA